MHRLQAEERSDYLLGRPKAPKLFSTIGGSAMIELPMPTLEMRDFDDIPVWTDEALFAACGVRVAFAGRTGGISAAPYDGLNLCGYVGDDPAAVAHNRARLLEVLGAAGFPLVAPRQIHGTEIIFADSGYPAPAERHEAIEADAVMVASSQLAAQLSFADCLPLIVAAPNGAFAVVHAGWRGALAGIANKAARALCAAVGCDAAQINAYIGPHIRSECFETSVEIASSFAQEYGAEILVDARHVDLAGVVSTDLVRVGVDAQRIADCRICTMCNSDEYFSYRASGGTCGRNAALAFRR